MRVTAVYNKELSGPNVDRAEVEKLGGRERKLIYNDRRKISGCLGMERAGEGGCEKGTTEDLWKLSGVVDTFPIMILAIIS